MPRWKSSARRIALLTAGYLLILISGRFAKAFDQTSTDGVPAQESRQSNEAATGAADEPGNRAGLNYEFVLDRIQRTGDWLARCYVATAPGDRVTWGGLVACAALGLGVLFERSIKLRRRRIVPTDFTERFLDKLHEGKLDCGRALDHCEMNPSPAARIALAAVRRWGRPSSDLERAVALAHRVETDRLRRNVGTLRRVAALAPLIGLLGSLLAIGRVLESMPAAAIPPGAVVESVPWAAPVINWGPALSHALSPLVAGIIVAALALVAYDGLLSRIERLTAALDRVGAETIDAIALAAPILAPHFSLGAAPSRPAPPTIANENDVARDSFATPHQPQFRRDAGADLRKRQEEQDVGF
jgi:biopolymer transport protein ExbB